MESVGWIKNLIIAEKKFEEKEPLQNPEVAACNAKEETIEFLKDLRAGFTETISIFNKMKGSKDGHIKIYDIDKTFADFMIFRNSHKMVFSALDPGKIKIYCRYAHSKNPADICIGSIYNASGTRLIWTYDNKEIRFDLLIKYFLSRFAKDSVC